MLITVNNFNYDYDAGFHPEVTKILFDREVAGEFFKDDRFPNLVELVCSYQRLTKLELNCPSLQKLRCAYNRLTKLELNCPDLVKLYCSCNLLTKLELNCPYLQVLGCSGNRLTKLELICPSLRTLWCSDNQLTDLNGLEFCADLNELCCSQVLRESVEILKLHLPDLVVSYD